MNDNKENEIKVNGVANGAAKPEVKERIVVGINSLHVSQHAAYSNHLRVFFHLGRKLPQYEFIFCNPPRMSIDRMRNMAATAAIQANAKWLVFIDDDVLIPPEFLERFIKAIDEKGYEILCANVMIRGYPFDYMMFRWNEDKTGLETLKQVPKNEVIDLDAIGFSCSLISVDLLRRLTKPYFITTHNMTEDVYFCLKARYEYPETKIGCDTGVECGHILWNEIIYENNRESYTEYYEKRFPSEVAALRPKNPEEDESKFRGEQYLNTIKQELTK